MFIIKRIYFSIIFLFSFLGCGDPPPPPMPAAETYRINVNQKAIPPRLNEAWEEKLHLVKGEPGLEDFRDNLLMLTEENRAFILEVLNNMTNKDHEIRFMQDFISFNKKQQGYLINILLYMEKQNKPLLLKATRCYSCTRWLERLKLRDMFKSLEGNCQDLIMEFVEKLQEEE
jgi:DNA-binding MarR family transcriptional regulator